MRTRYVLIGYNTDTKNRDTHVHFTRSKHQLQEWLLLLQDHERAARLVHADSAVIKNWHRRIHQLYVLPFGWRPPSRVSLYKKATEQSCPDYKKTIWDAMADAIREVAKEIIEFSDVAV